MFRRRGRRNVLFSIILIGVGSFFFISKNRWTDQIESKYNILEDESFTAFHGLPQKCKIPVLDPYHPDVKPFIKTWSVPDCDYPQLSEVTDEGYLQVSEAILSR